jgi:hypothetical protein
MWGGLHAHYRCTRKSYFLLLFHFHHFGYRKAWSHMALSFIICGRELLRDVSQSSVEVLRMVTGTW